MDGSSVDFMNWADDEPDYPGARTKFVGGQSGNYIYDRGPENNCLLVCQMGREGLAIVKEHPLICDVPFVPLGDRCIYVNVTQSTRDEAVEACYEMCPACTLASIHNDDEMNVIQRLGRNT